MHHGLHDLKGLANRPAAGSLYQCVSAAIRTSGLNPAKAELFEASFMTRLQGITKPLGSVTSYDVMIDACAWASYDCWSYHVAEHPQQIETLRISLWEMLTGSNISTT